MPPPVPPPNLNTRMRGVSDPGVGSGLSPGYPIGGRSRPVVPLASARRCVPENLAQYEGPKWARRAPITAGMMRTRHDVVQGSSTPRVRGARAPPPEGSVTPVSVARGLDDVVPSAWSRACVMVAESGLTSPSVRFRSAQTTSTATHHAAYSIGDWQAHNRPHGPGDRRCHGMLYCREIFRTSGGYYNACNTVGIS